MSDKLWVQVAGTCKPTQVPYEDGTDVDDLIIAAKAKMPNALSADPYDIIVSKDQGAIHTLDEDFKVSDLKEGNFRQNPIWLTVPDTNDHEICYHTL